MDIDKQYDKIYRYCYFRLHDMQSAQDITQETFLRFFKQNPNLEHSKELPYLYTIAKNLCIDEFHKKAVDSLEEGVEIDGPYFDKSEDLINSITLRATIEKLKPEEKELLFLRYVNEISVASICKIMGMSRFAVYRRLSKVLKKLKEELMKEGFFE